MTTAECTWGDGPDVLLVIKNEPYGLMLHAPPKHTNKATYGYAGDGSLDLTSKQAKKLAAQLVQAAENADRMDRACREHDAEGRGPSSDREWARP